MASTISLGAVLIFPNSKKGLSSSKNTFCKPLSVHALKKSLNMNSKLSRLMYIEIATEIRFLIRLTFISLSASLELEYPVRKNSCTIGPSRFWNIVRLVSGLAGMSAKYSKSPAYNLLKNTRLLFQLPLSWESFNTAFLQDRILVKYRSEE